MTARLARAGLCVRSQLGHHRHPVPMMMMGCRQTIGRRWMSSKEGDPPQTETPPPEETPKEEEEAWVKASELAACATERDEYRDKMMRALAEAENARTIARRDVAQAREYAISSFAKSLLEVADNLGYALGAAKEEKPSLENLVEGVEMTRSLLVKAFTNGGIAEFGAVGDKFDPALHEALFEYQDPEKEPTTVGQVLKTGFTLNSRVIRAAQVGIVKK